MRNDLARAESAAVASYSMSPKFWTLRLNEPRLRLRAVEFGAGDPVVLVHGLTLSTLHWTPLMSRLEGFRLIGLDMPGHGGSDPFDFDSIDLREWHVRLLASALDELELGSAHFIGHSYGAMFAMWLALAAPDRVRSIVVVGAPSVAFGAKADRLLSALALPVIGRGILVAPTPYSIYRRLLSASLGKHAVDSAPDQLIRATYLASRRRGFANTVSSYLRAQLRNPDQQRYVLSATELRSLACPILVVWGNGDRRYQSPDEGRRVASVIPSARFETVPGGHEPWLDDLNSCASHISGFLNRVSAQPSLA